MCMSANSALFTLEIVEPRGFLSIIVNFPCEVTEHAIHSISYIYMHISDFADLLSFILSCLCNCLGWKNKTKEGLQRSVALEHKAIH